MPLIERILDPSQAPAIVAEMSGNHCQRLETAKELIEIAAASGAHAVKLQTYTADSLTLPIDSEDFSVKGGLWNGRSLYDLYSEASTPYHWHAELAKCARDSGIELFSTPFDEDAVDFLESEISPEIYKVSSFEATHIPLLEKVGATGKPTLLSVGMATEPEIEEAIAALKSNGCPTVALLKCISAYPATPDSFNLLSMPALAKRFDCPVGLSDHCLTNEIAVSSVALGARVIEKHFTNARNAGGIDAGFSLEPHELRQLVDQTAIAHSSLGSDRIGASKQDAHQMKFRRSIYVSRAVSKGEPLTAQNLKIVRPSFGLAPKHWRSVLGKTVRSDLSLGHPLSWDDLD